MVSGFGSTCPTRTEMFLQVALVEAAAPLNGVGGVCLKQSPLVEAFHAGRIEAAFALKPFCKGGEEVIVAGKQDDDSLEVIVKQMFFLG